MTPNLYLATQKAFSPHKWFKSSPKTERPTRKTEHWNKPIPGIYEYIPGRGWYLIATDKEPAADTDHEPLSPGGPAPAVQAVDDQSQDVQRETIKVPKPIQVIYSKVLKRYLLAPDYETRKRYGKVQDDAGKRIVAQFFRLDDGIAWVHCWDEHGEFIPGPYKLWCIDEHTGEFRHMLKGDDPDFTRSRANSLKSTDHTLRRRRSQESRITQFKPGPGSSKDGFSVPSTRANSIRNFTTSGSASAPASRRTSPRRQSHSPSQALDAASTALRQVADERLRSQSRASSTESTSRARSATTTTSPVHGGEESDVGSPDLSAR